MKSAIYRAGRFPLFFQLVCIGAMVPFFNAGAADSPSPAATGGNGGKAIRIYNCNQQVQSSKRGLCANKLSPEDILALAPGVSWYYNWSFTTDDTVPKGVHFDFFPEVWGREEDVDGLADYLSTHPKTRAVLAINEPNIRGQAFISPEETAALYGKTKAVADKYGVPVIGPNMAMGSLPDDSIVAMDPIDKKSVTYRSMVPFLKAFDFFMGGNGTTATAYHSYGNLGEMKWSVGMMKQTFNKPVWVTEYAQWRTNTPQQMMDYLVKATDLLEASPDVAGYAWFKERSDDMKGLALLEEEPGKLTALGQAYVALPVHDADVYYRIPGRLPADHYLTADRAEIERTSDAGGMFDMLSHGAGTLEYHIQVDKAGRYKLNFRVSGPAGAIQVLQGDQVLGTANVQAPANAQQAAPAAPAAQTAPVAQAIPWQNAAATVKLPAGPQTLRIRTSGQALAWIEFSKP